MQDSFFASSKKKSGIRKELQVVNSVGAWNLPVVDFGSAWAAKSASGLVPVWNSCDWAKKLETIVILPNLA